MQDFTAIGRGPVLVLGRAGMDLYADPPGERVETAERFFACLGGSSGNIAAGLARAGQTAELVSCVSDDAVGRFVLGQLDQYGIGRRHVCTVGGQARTSLAVTETQIENTQTVIYRNGAADLLIGPEQVDAIEPSRFGALIVTGTALATEPSRSATRSLMARAAPAGCAVILDLDYRPYSWASAEEVSAVYVDAARSCHIIVGNDEEFAAMANADDGEPLARDLAADGRIAVYKRGALGSRTHVGSDLIETEIFAVVAIKPMGAGDAFMAGLVAALQQGRDLPEALRRGSAAAAIVVSGLGCAPAMPTTEALERFMAGHPSPPA